MWSGQKSRAKRSSLSVKIWSTSAHLVNHLSPVKRIWEAWIKHISFLSPNMTWNWKVGSQISGLLSLLPGSARLLFVTGDGAVMSTVRTQDPALIRSCFSSGRRYWKSQGVSRGQNNRISDIVSSATTSAQCWGQEQIFGKIQVCRENQVLIDFVMHEWTVHYGPGVSRVVTVSDKLFFFLLQKRRLDD